MRIRALPLVLLLPVASECGRNPSATAFAAARVRPNLRGDRKIHTAERPLTPFEKAEILDLARMFDAEARAAYGWRAFVACLWTFGALAMENAVYGLVAAAAGAGWLVFLAWRWLATYAWTSGLRVDARIGYVVLSREQAMPAAPIELESGALGGSSGRSGPLLTPGIEHLPSSGTIWTLDGRPARWRGRDADDSAG